jgi:glycosyltransferase involved in cell wall biosynthesis
LVVYYSLRPKPIMNLSKDKTCVLVINHYMTRAKGSEETDQRTLNYLLDKVKKIILIAHPFPNSPSNQTIFETYESGKLIKEERISILKGPQVLQYLIHVILTLFLFIKAHTRFDLCIAMENLSFSTLFPFRFVGLIRRIVYYSVDFLPHRFPNPLLNNFYHFLDRFACNHSDANWVMVKKQIEERRIRGISKKNSSPFILAPIGYITSLIDIKSIHRIDYYNLIFAGALLENSGPQLGIQALPLLLKKFPKIHYTIIGKGIYENQLKSLAKKLNVQSRVKFTGYIDSFKDLTERISLGSIGLAPFVPNPDSLSFYSDPSKIKLYLVCGIPVITTSVTTIAPLIKKTKAGIVINYNDRSIYEAIEIMLSSKAKYEYYRRSAINLSKQYDIDHILKAAFRKIPQ